MLCGVAGLHQASLARRCRG